MKKIEEKNKTSFKKIKNEKHERKLGQGDENLIIDK